MAHLGLDRATIGVVSTGWMLRRPTRLRASRSRRTAFTVRRILDIEDVVLGRDGVDLPLHDDVDIDDVLVAGQHQALFDHVGWREVRTRFDRAEPTSVVTTLVTWGLITPPIG